MLIMILFVGVIGVFFSDKDSRWEMFHADEAEAYAERLLREENTPQGDQPIAGYSASKHNGYVVFAKPTDHSSIYGYFPETPPSEIAGTGASKKWQRLDDNWFVYHH
uniref:hypothetical protein n=1 Tax=Vibrio sp. TaxID=678 RepID=UPI001F3F3F1E|nr:hypothetical protein [Vibrio sp.]